MLEVKNPTLEELAQKMYNESGGQGNLYRQEPGIVRRYEDKALEILGEEKKEQEEPW